MTSGRPEIAASCSPSTSTVDGPTSSGSSDREAASSAGTSPTASSRATSRFRGIDLGYGPDGGVFVLDWNDSGECHENTGVHRTSGRIFKITEGSRTGPTIGDLTKLDPSALVDLHRHANEWYARMARASSSTARAGARVIREGATEGADGDAVDGGRPGPQAPALWTLHALGSGRRDALEGPAPPSMITSPPSLGDPAPHGPDAARHRDEAAGRRSKPVAASDGLLGEFAGMARDDPSGLVRLDARRRPSSGSPVSHASPALAAPAAGPKEDAGDHNLPLLIWYGLIPVADADPSPSPDSRPRLRLADDPSAHRQETGRGPRQETPARSTRSSPSRRLVVGPRPSRPTSSRGSPRGSRAGGRPRSLAAWDALICGLGSRLGRRCRRSGLQGPRPERPVRRRPSPRRDEAARLDDKAESRDPPGRAQGG